MSAKTKILIVRFSSIGDIVLCSPVLRALNEQWPGPLEIHFLTKKTFAGLVENNVNIHRVWTIDHSVSEIIPALKQEKFDLIVDLHRNLRSTSLLIRLMRPFVRFNKLNLRKWLYVCFGWNLMPEKHIVDRYFDTLKKFGINNDKKGLDYFFSPDFSPKALPVEKYIVFALGGAHLGKKMKAEQWTEAGTDSELPVVLIGGKEDYEESLIIASVLGKNCINLCGSLSIDGSADVIQKSEVVVSGDTGMMHIASAFQKKIISVWGCTVPQFGMYPYLPHSGSIMLEPKSRRKRPCSKLGNHCKYGMENRCITSISKNEITSAICDLLKAE